MRVVIQRVSSASVSVNGEVLSRIGKGLLCYVGIGEEDNESDAEYAANKILNARLWPSQDEKKPWHTSVLTNNFEVLVISQFTLYGFFKGNKPDYHLAMSPEPAEKLYNFVVDLLRKKHKPDRVGEGKFGGFMEVESTNWGPVTMEIDSHRRGLQKRNQNVSGEGGNNGVEVGSKSCTRDDNDISEVIQAKATKSKEDEDKLRGGVASLKL